MSGRRSYALAAALGVALVIPSSLAQPPETDDDLRELIVLLAPESRGAPSPEEVVDAISAGIGPIPGGLGEGNPQRARLAITRRARGRQRLRIAQDEESDEARLQRYVVLGFGPEADLDGVMRGRGPQQACRIPREEQEGAAPRRGAADQGGPARRRAAGDSGVASGGWAVGLPPAPLRRGRMLGGRRTRFRDHYRPWPPDDP